MSEMKTAFGRYEENMYVANCSCVKMFIWVRIILMSHSQTNYYISTWSQQIGLPNS